MGRVIGGVRESRRSFPPGHEHHRVAGPRLRKLGQEAEANKVLDELKSRAKESNISSYQIALVYVGLGEKEQALQALDEALQEHSTLLAYLKMDPRFDPLRSDPRFQELLRRVGLRET